MGERERKQMRSRDDKMSPVFGDKDGDKHKAYSKRD